MTSKEARAPRWPTICTECGKAVRTKNPVHNRDAGNVKHTFHRVCWKRFRAWLSAPVAE